MKTSKVNTKEKVINLISINCRKELAKQSKLSEHINDNNLYLHNVTLNSVIQIINEQLKLWL